MNDTIRALGLPDPDAVFPNEYGTSCYIIGIRKDIREKIGKRPGDRVFVTVTEANAEG